MEPQVEPLLEPLCVSQLGHRDTVWLHLLYALRNCRGNIKGDDGDQTDELDRNMAPTH